MKILSFLLAALAFFTACEMVPESLTSSESRAFAERAHLLISEQISGGFIVGKSIKVEISDGDALLNRKDQTPVVNGKEGTVVPACDIETLQNTYPHLYRLMWQKPQKRIGTAIFRWIGASGLEYRFEFFGPLDKAEACRYRFISPPIFEVENAKIYDKPVPPSEGNIRFEVM